MKLDIIAGNKNDEYYTPRYAIRPLLKHLNSNSKILCPFDTHQSRYVEVFREAGHVVTHSHLSEGKDFFDYTSADLADYDYIISNPPYSVKGKVFNKLYELGKPFAMLVGVVGLFESKDRFNMFKNNKFEIMYLDKRVSYFGSFTENLPFLNPPFQSVYICSNVLKDQIVFEEINKKDI
jgi:hypothetical protein